MIKNHLSSYGRLLLLSTMLFVMLLISGCCSFCDKEKFCTTTASVEAATESNDSVCGKAVVYAFDIPNSQSDCPSGYEFRDENVDGYEHDGGAGIVERDGGAGIVERESGATVTKYCLKPCPDGEEFKDPTAPREMDWNPENKVVTAIQDCNPVQEPVTPESDQESEE